VFLQGGGDGAAGFSRILAVLLAVPKIQVILATGTNRVLAAHYAKRGIPGLRVLPFTREIAPYMAMADVVMGKAGPNTLFEALTLGKPFIATSYIPGQEEGNLEFIRRHQLGWVATKRLELLDLVSELAGNPEELDMMRSRLKALGERNRQQTGAILPVIDGLLGGCTHPICVG
jgi:UDP-N-acetylglucosamine:LPS N-acetylglucosamine transferase